MKIEEFNNKKIDQKTSNISVLLPTFYSNKKVWIGLESILNFNDQDIIWDLIICDDNGETFKVINKYLAEILDKNCCLIKYINVDSINDGVFENKFTLLEKWKLMAQHAVSDICILQADDNFSPPNRLKIHINHFKNDNCYFSTFPIGPFYNVSTNEQFIYDGYKRKRYHNVKMMHMNMAHLTKYLKEIEISFLKSGVDQYILRDIYNQINKDKNTIINFNKTIFYDESDQWKYGFFTDGLNCISNRKHLYKKSEEKSNKIIDYFIKSGNNRQSKENGELIDATKKVCRSCWCLSKTKKVYDYYNYFGITNYVNNTLLRLLILQNFLLEKDLYKEDKLINNFINLLPIRKYNIDVNKLKYKHLFSLINKEDVILDPTEYLLSINISELEVWKRNNINTEMQNKLNTFQKILINNFYCKKVLYITDCHNYTFNGRYENLLKYIKLFNIQYICLRIKYSAEYFHMKKILYPFCQVICVPWILNPNNFLNVSSNKKYDLLFYGSDYKHSYPFRYRLKNLLKTEKFKQNFKIRIIEQNENIKGSQLYDMISQSYLTFSTKSKYNYLVKKYFEIPLSLSFIIGNMPDYGYHFFNNNDFINIEENMSDQQIFNIVKNALSQKELLLNKTLTTYKKIIDLQSIKVHDLSFNEIKNPIIKINGYDFTKDVLYIENFTEENIDFILSYKTILIKTMNDFKILNKYDISDKFIYLLKYEKKIKAIDTNITIVFDYINNFVKNMNVVYLKGDAIFYYN